LGLIKLTPHPILLGFHIEKYEMCGTRGTLGERKEVTWGNLRERESDNWENQVAEGSVMSNWIF